MAGGGSEWFNKLSEENQKKFRTAIGKKMEEDAAAQRQGVMDKYIAGGGSVETLKGMYNVNPKIAEGDIYKAFQQSGAFDAPQEEAAKPQAKPQAKPNSPIKVGVAGETKFSEAEQAANRAKLGGLFGGSDAIPDVTDAMSWRNRGNAAARMEGFEDLTMAEKMGIDNGTASPELMERVRSAQDKGAVDWANAVDPESLSAGQGLMRDAVLNGGTSSQESLDASGLDAGYKEVWGKRGDGESTYELITNADGNTGNINYNDPNHKFRASDAARVGQYEMTEREGGNAAMQEALTYAMMVAGGPIAGALAPVLGAAGAAAAVGGATSAMQGGDLEDILKGAAGGALTSGLGGYAEKFGGDYRGGFITGAGNEAIKQAVDGEFDLGEIAKGGLMGSGTNVLTDTVGDIFQTDDPVELAKQELATNDKYDLLNRNPNELSGAQLDEYHSLSKDFDSHINRLTDSTNLGGLLNKDRDGLLNKLGIDADNMDTSLISGALGAAAKPFNWAASKLGMDALYDPKATALSNQKNLDSYFDDQYAKLDEEYLSGSRSSEAIMADKSRLQDLQKSSADSGWAQQGFNEQEKWAEDMNFGKHGDLESRSEEATAALDTKRDELQAKYLDGEKLPEGMDQQGAEQMYDREMAKAQNEWKADQDQLAQDLYERDVRYDERYKAFEEREETPITGIKEENPLGAGRPTAGLPGEGLMQGGKDALESGQNVLNAVKNKGADFINNARNAYEDWQSGASSIVSEDNPYYQDYMAQNPQASIDGGNTDTSPITDEFFPEMGAPPQQPVDSGGDQVLPEAPQQAPSIEDEVVEDIESGDMDLIDGTLPDDAFDDVLNGGDDVLPESPSTGFPKGEVSEEEDLPPADTVPPAGGGSPAALPKEKEAVQRRVAKNEEELFRLARIMKIMPLSEKQKQSVGERMNALQAEQSEMVKGDVTAGVDKDTTNYVQRLKEKDLKRLEKKGLLQPTPKAEAAA